MFFWLPLQGWAENEQDLVIVLEIEPLPKPRAEGVPSFSFDGFELRHDDMAQDLPSQIEERGGFVAPEIHSIQGNALLQILRAKLGTLNLSGFCPLSQSAASNSLLRDLMRRDALARDRLPVEIFAPCDELLTFEADIALPSVLIRLDLISPDTNPKGAVLVARLAQELASLPQVNEMQIKRALEPISTLNLQPQVRVIRPDGYLTLLERGHADAFFVSFSGVIAAGEDVWMITLNAGMNASMILPDLYAIFDTALRHMAAYDL